MFQNVLMTTLTPISDTNETQNWENRPFMKRWPEDRKSLKSLKDATITKTIKKKNKRNRTAYTTEQLRVLERTFTVSKYIDAERRRELSECLQIGEKCIKVWFQNRRMKEKKASSESSCESSSECGTEPVTPPPIITQSNEEYKVNCSYNEVPHLNERERYFYPHEANKTDIQHQHGYYQNWEPVPFINYNSHLQPNEYFQNDANVYPTQYYPSENVNFDNNQNCGHSDAYNWSVNRFDLNYF